jgi:hypothetical protein
MKGTRLVIALLTAGPILAPPSCLGAAERGTSPKVTEDVVRGHCSVCHGYRLVETQRLDRANWEWVMEDMVRKFGAAWIGPELQRLIIDYLVEHHGPEQ